MTSIALIVSSSRLGSRARAASAHPRATTVHYRRVGDQIESDRFDVRDRGRAGVIASTVLVVAVVVALIVLLVSRH